MDQESQNEGARRRSRSNSSEHPSRAPQSSQSSREQQMIDSLLSGLSKAAPITPTPSPRASLEVLTARAHSTDKHRSSKDSEEVEMQSLISQEENTDTLESGDVDSASVVATVDVKNSKLSYFLLVLLGQVGFGLFFCYDSVRAIAPTLKSEIGLSSFQIGLLFSGYSFPAVFQMYGASAFDKYGVRIVIVICAALMTVGTAIPLVHPTFPLLLIGQIVFGLGGMNIYVLIISVLGTWFNGQKNASFKATFALSIIGFWQRIASFVTYNTLPVISKHTNFKVALGVALLVCIVSLACAALFAWLDRYRVVVPVTHAHKQLTDEENEQEEGESDNSVYNNNNNNKDKKRQKYSNNTSRGSGSKVQNIMQTLRSTTEWMKLLSFSYWCLLVLGFVGVATIYTFVAFGTTVLTAHGYDIDRASQITSLSSLVYAISTPLLGFMVGGLSRFRIHFSIVCSVCLSLVYLLFATTDMYTVIFPALGAVQALSDVVVFSSVGLVVDHSIIGKATGLIVLCYNIGLFSLPLIIGSLYDNGMTRAVYALFIGFGVLAIGASVAWKLFGKVQQGITK